MTVEKKIKTIQKYDRHSRVDLEPVILLITEAYERKFKKLRVAINGNDVSLTSLRLQTFALKGTVCHCCGLKATHFAIERDLSAAARDGGYHLNLWGINEKSEEVLFTHDHTLARGLGGKDHISNTETMCCYCNWDKGDLESIEVAKMKEKQK